MTNFGKFIANCKHLVSVVVPRVVLYYNLKQNIRENGGESYVGI